VNKVVTGELPIDDYITHFYTTLDDVNKSIDELHSGNCLRAVVEINDPPERHRYPVKVLSSRRHCGGVLKTVEHWSDVNKCNMIFNIYLPEAEVNQQRGEPYPVLYFLSGLEGTHQNGAEKSGFGNYAKQHNIAVIFPDTSPRSTGIEGIDQDWTWGHSASYYVDATAEKYKTNFNMFTYINEELPRIASQHFPVSFSNKSITGFSMGGHGALISGLKTGAFKSVSAFAPITNPTQSAWGTKAYEEFFGSAEAGKDWDATSLITSKDFKKVPLLVDVGTADKHHPKLKVYEFVQAVHNAGLKLEFKERDQYDHSFWYVATFIEEHIQFHSQFLNRWD
jgi:S-formylglutathione hydrolase